MKPKEVSIEYGDVKLQGTLAVPDKAKAIILFAHGSGSGRFCAACRRTQRGQSENGGDRRQHGADHRLLRFTVCHGRSPLHLCNERPWLLIASIEIVS